jgi:hypothetical protein
MAGIYGYSNHKKARANPMELMHQMAFDKRRHIAAFGGWTRHFVPRL